MQNASAFTAFVHLRAVFASEISRWSGASNGFGDTGGEYVVDDANGKALQKSFATAPACKVWFNSGDCAWCEPRFHYEGTNQVQRVVIKRLLG